MTEHTVRVDLHSHTRYSLDAWMTPRQLVERAAEMGIDRIAVTDHAALDGALEARSLDPGRVIVGEEVRCAERIDLVGLFLREWIPNGLPAIEAAARIHDQQGVVYAPHPYAHVFRARRRAARALAVADVVEVFNARAFLPGWNRRAREAAAARGLPGAAGSDAHFSREIGRAYCVMPAFSDAPGFLTAVASARLGVARTSNAGVHVLSMMLSAARRTARRTRRACRA